MSLNIKNEEAHRLARELSSLTGESMARAVVSALRERIARLRRAGRRDLGERLRAIGKDCAAHLDEAARSIDHGDMLYDEKGLPR